MESQAFIIEGLRKHGSLVELLRSRFFREWRMRIEMLLATPKTFSFEGTAPFLRSFIRIVQWNIEKGKRFDAILDYFQTNEILRWADVIILNEADCGMNRSGNRHVALDLAKNLGMNMAFGPAHIELTKGTDDELAIEGENRESLQGNAVLSRYPIREAYIVPLPALFEPYEFHEKRFGRRNCLWARLELKEGHLWVGSTHLEVRTTPRSRSAQIEHLMENLPDKGQDAYILGGDLNTNSFSRGTTWRALQSVSRLMTRSPSRIKDQLLHPERGSEPLFDVMKYRGFAWQGFNSYEETARADIGSLEETGFLPDALANMVKKRLEPYSGYLCFKLDWIVAKGIQALKGGQKSDLQTEVRSLDPGCLKGKNAGPDRISDHLPIHADISVA
jgi:endonuclease/exonuclease/phosphatase family metal-dependent hydrolase